MKDVCIILDSVDKCGKDTIKDAIIKSTNGEVLVFVRGFISQIAYSRLYNRNINEKFFIEKIKQFYNIDVKFVLLTCSEEALIERFDKHNEKDLPKEDILRHLNMFNVVTDELINLGIDVLKVDTSYLTIEECVKKIINWTEN